MLILWEIPKHGVVINLAKLQMSQKLFAEPICIYLYVKVLVLTFRQSMQKEVDILGFVVLYSCV